MNKALIQNRPGDRPGYVLTPEHLYILDEEHDLHIRARQNLIRGKRLKR